MKFKRSCAAEKEHGHFIGIAAEGGERDVVVTVLQAQFVLDLVKKTLKIGRTKIPIGDLRRLSAVVGKGALLAPDHLAEKRRWRGLPMPFGSAKGRRRQWQGRKSLAAGDALGRSFGRFAQRHKPIVFIRSV